MSGMGTKHIQHLHTVIILAAYTTVHCCCTEFPSFSYHHPHLESPLDETSSHDPHHRHKTWAYHHGLEVCSVVGMSGYNRDTLSLNLNVTFIT